MSDLPRTVHSAFAQQEADAKARRGVLELASVRGRRPVRTESSIARK
jgi:hypothetical protein